MSYGVGLRRGTDLVLPWLWCRLAAVSLIRPLAREAPYAVGAALKRQKTKKILQETVDRTHEVILVSPLKIASII